MLTKFSLKAIPLAAAMTAALVFGAAAQAQSGTAATTLPAGTTKAQDAIINPAPTAGKDGKVARQETDSGSAKKLGATGIGGTTKGQDAITDPTPLAGKPMTADERAAAKAAKADKKAARVAKRAERRSKDAATGDLKGTILDPSRQ